MTDSEPQAPWPYYHQKAAARRLNVEVEFLSGLANNPIPAIKVLGKSGNSVWLFQKDAIDSFINQVSSVKE